MGTYAKSVFIALLCSTAVWGKTNEPIFQDPFDIGGGGASLTRATQEGMLASNPAMMPYGAKFFRWLGLKTSISVGQDSVDFAKSAAKGSKGEGDSAAQNQAFVDKIFDTPIHLGVAESLTFITSNFGMTVFTSTEPDIRAWKRGDPELGAGTPTIALRNELYGGALVSFAQRTPLPWFSYGLTGKYLLADERKINVEITDQTAITNAREEAQSLKAVPKKPAFGTDFGTLIFAQGNILDWRFASTVTNIGGTQFAEGAEPSEFKQMVNFGTSLTLHSDADAIHFAVDYRDALGAYDDLQYKHIYAGTKITIHRFLGLSAGLYQFNPTYGIELDLFFMRLAAASYAREYGRSPGVDRRPIYVISFSLGFEL